jgi:hypothetical protein
MRVATLKVSLVRGRALTGMQRPYAELNVEGFEQRTKTGKGPAPDWQSDKAFVVHAEREGENDQNLLVISYNVVSNI